MYLFQLLTLFIAVSHAHPTRNPLSHDLFNTKPPSSNKQCLINRPGFSLNPAHFNATEPVWPPGYIPNVHPYIYHVRFSTITLSCNVFQPQDNWNPLQIEHLLARLIVQYGNPAQQDNELYNGRDIVYQWTEGAIVSGITAFQVTLPPLPREWRDLTYGKLVNAVMGVNHIRLAYPNLSMCCNVLNEVRGVDRIEGAISLVYVD